MEQYLRSLWAEVLDRDEPNLPSNANFFELGGDSVAVMKAVTLARTQGVTLDASDLFTHPTVSDLAEQLSVWPISNKNDVRASPMVPDIDLKSRPDLLTVCLAQCDLAEDDIVSVMPCLYDEAWFMNIHHNTGGMISHAVFEITPGSEERAKICFDIVCKRNENYRTRIVQYCGILYRVVCKDTSEWKEFTGDLEEFTARDRFKRMTYGMTLSRRTIIRNEGKTWIVWTLAQPITDRFTRYNTLDDLRRCFQDPGKFDLLPLRPSYTEYVRFIANLDEQHALEFWKYRLQGVHRYDLLKPESDIGQETLSHPKHITVKITRPQIGQTSIRFATIAYAAYAFAMANLAEVDDVFYTSARSTRHIPLPGAGDLLGCLTALSFVHVQLDPSKTVQAILEDLQQDADAAIPHASFCTKALRDHFGHDRFSQNNFVIQPDVKHAGEPNMVASDEQTGAEYTTRYLSDKFAEYDFPFPFCIIATPVGDEINLVCAWYESFVPEDRALYVLETFKAMLERVISISKEWSDVPTSVLCPHLSETKTQRLSTLSEPISASRIKDSRSTDMAILQNILSNANKKAVAVVLPGSPPTDITYEHLRRNVESLQQQLSAIGVQPGVPVSMYLPNSYELVVAFLATTWQGGIASPLNPSYKQAELEFYLEDLNSGIILIEHGAYERGVPAIAAARTFHASIAEVKWNGHRVVLELKENNGLDHHDGVPLGMPLEHDVALILHTSGTTSKPKAVPLTHQNLMSNIDNIIKTYDLTPKDRTMLIMPLFHVHGLLASFMSPLKSGGTIILPSRLLPSFWSDFEKYKATWYSATPTMHRLILNHPYPENNAPIPRFIRSCSSPLPPSLLHKLETKFKAPVLESYAMTEASHLMTSNPLPPAPHHAATVGIPQGELELRILDSSNNEVPPGTEGEVCIRGPNVTTGYLNNDVANADAFTTSGFFRTGDVGKLDPGRSNYLVLTGRIKEMVNKGGEKISPVELDNVISQHEAVAEVVCFAVEDEMYGQDVGCAVRLQTGLDLSVKELKGWIAERISALKVPGKVWIVDEIPKGATGKVSRINVAKEMQKKQDGNE